MLCMLRLKWHLSTPHLRSPLCSLTAHELALLIWHPHVCWRRCAAGLLLLLPRVLHWLPRELRLLLLLLLQVEVRDACLQRLQPRV